SLPSDIVKIFDPNMDQEQGAAGVITAVTDHVITLDREVSLSSQNTLMIFSTEQGIEEYTVIGAPGSRRLEVDHTTIADVGARWVLYHATPPKQWRITAITEEDDGTYTVNAIAHDPDKYKKIDEERALGVSKENTPIPSLKAPSNYRVEQSLSYHGGMAEAVLIVAFDGDPNAAYYEYQVRSNDGNYSDVKTTHLNRCEP
ncbi:hypothetical protein ACR9PT_14605, partial [Piscirickettsia salmonis]|uniref:hypothetical protein n=1 Tax=Piscirickettsia salmonis TaxID=1238 RepID=UPI003EBBD69B